MGNDAPDTSGQQQAALMNASLSKEQLDWAKQIYQETAPERAAATTRANAVSDAQLEGMNEQTRQARETSAFMDKNLRPLQQSIVDDARTFDTEGKREELAGLALGDVNSSFDSAREQAGRDMARRGVNVSDGNYGSAIKQLALGQAMAGADAKNKARTGAITLAGAKRSDAVAALSGLPGNAATQAGLALSAGNSATGNATAALQPGQQAQIQLSQGYGAARQGYGQAANIYGDIARTEAGGDAAGNAAGAGLAGAAMTAAAIF